MICIDKSILAIKVFDFSRNTSLKEPATSCCSSKDAQGDFFFTAAGGGTLMLRACNGAGEDPGIRGMRSHSHVGYGTENTHTSIGN